MYDWPVTVAGLLEQLLSMEEKSPVVAVDAGADTVTVTVLAAAWPSGANWASLLLASLTRLDSMPTPAARPMTAAHSMAMTLESTKTSSEQPHMVAVRALSDRIGSEGSPKDEGGI